MLVVEAALGNICNTLGAEDNKMKKMLKGYNSLRVMGSYGPLFSQNLVRKDGSIWPMGEVKQYEQPQYKYEDRLFGTYN